MCTLDTQIKRSGLRISHSKVFSSDSSTYLLSGSSKSWSLYNGSGKDKVRKKDQKMNMMIFNIKKREGEGVEEVVWMVRRV